MRKTLVILALGLGAIWVSRSATILQIWGVPPAMSPGVSTVQSTTTAAIWVAFSLTPRVNHTVGAFHFMVSAVAGTLGAGDVDVEIYSDNGVGKPNAALGGGCSTTTVTTTPTGALFVAATGLSCALTAGTQYFFVVKNLNGTPASNNFGIRGGSSGSAVPPGGSPAAQAIGTGMMLTTTNSGTAWSLLSNQLAFWRIDYSDDGSYDGLPITNTTNPDTTNTVYAGRELGSVFTTPLASMKVVGIGMQVGSTTAGNAPTGSARFGIKCGNSGTLTDLGYTASIPQASVATISFVTGWYASPVTLPASSTCRVLLSETTQADASTKNYRITQTTIDNDANSRSVMPFQGTLKMSYCTGTCGTASNWTDTNTAYYAFVLYLDPAGEMPSQGGSGIPTYPIGSLLHWPLFQPPYHAVRAGA